MDPAQVPPPSLSQYMPSAAPPPPMSHRHWHRVLFSGLLIGILLLVVTVSLLSVYSHMHILGISAPTRLSIVKVMGHIPLLPKTPEQILLDTVESNIKLTKYTPDFSFSGAFHSSSIEAASLDLRIKGPVDYTDLNHVTFDMTATIAANFAGTQYLGIGLIKKNGDKVYAKIDHVSDSVIDGVVGLGSMFSGPTQESSDSARRLAEIRGNIQQALINWLVYDTSGMASEARTQLNTITNEHSLTENVQKQANQFLLQDIVLPEVKKEAEETIDGIPSYHLSLTPSKNLISTLIRKGIDAYEAQQSTSQYSSKMTDKEKDQAVTMITNSLENVRTDLWVGKSDSIIRKNSSQIGIDLTNLFTTYRQELNTYQSTLPMAPTSESLAAAHVSFTSVLSIHNIGQTVTVSDPSPTKTPMEFLTILSDALKTQEDKTHDIRQEQWKSDFRQIQALLLRYYAAHNATYPLALPIAIQAYVPPGDPLVKRVADYTYQRSTDGRAYLLYVDDPYATSHPSYNSSPLYGISSSDSNYPHYLSQYDFNSFSSPTDSSYYPGSSRIIPTPQPTYQRSGSTLQRSDGVLGIMSNLLDTLGASN